MDWDAFHRQVIEAGLPPQGLPANRFWVGILLPQKTPGEHLVQADFQWMKAHAKIPVEKILASYRAIDPNPKIQLDFNHGITPSTTVKELNNYEDNIILLRAVERNPEPTTEPATDPTPRTPLQPVNRQLSAQAESSTPGPNAQYYTAAVGIKTTVSANQNVPAPYPSQIGMPLPSAQENRENNPPTPWDSYGRAPFAPPPAPPTGPNTAPYVSPYANPVANEHGYGGPSMPAPVKAEEGQAHETPEEKPLASSFDTAAVFAKESSVDRECEAEPRPTDAQIRRLIETKDLDLLEAGVDQAMKVLDTLKGTFSQYDSNADAKAWMTAIDKLKLQAERKRTVVGVVGNTGAGKSSVINAMLDEERLVPTNCMRACTAVVTELSWNDSTNPNSKYRAAIEFISRAEWEKELSALLKEFLTDSGSLSREVSDQNSEAGVAWAKFHAVYPHKTKDMLPECTVAKLMTERSVLDVLGTTKNIDKATPEPFYRELQRYVDSKEKATGKKDKNKSQSARQMEYWPLIKVVKIRTKSPALSTGAVIVDLPGVHDSNAARAAVAQGYIKQCTGLWIVAPINRAVDDKAAKTLMGDSFKRQLKYDGGFSSVTFICSKTDDISITEAEDSLGLEDQLAGLREQESEQKQKIVDLQDKISELRESQAIYNVAYDSAVDDIEIWEELKDRMNKGVTVYAPRVATAKRKRGKESKKSRKRRQTEDDSDDDFIVSDDNTSSDESDSDNDENQSPRQPLTEEDIEAKLTELKETKKNARRSRNELEPQIKDVRPEIREAKERLAEVRSEMSAICISGRNDYSKGAIQLDFAAGIKELDQENAAEEDEENFNPDEDLRDYDEVAKSLPVFCVSSRAYQQMSGRLQKDEPVPGFKTPEETEIPQLQAHCKKLTEAGRIQTCRSFLLNLCQLLNTFSFWASDDGSGLNLSDKEKRDQVAYLDRRLNELDKGLQKAVESCIQLVKKEITDQISERYSEVIQEAANAAPATANGWGLHRDQGGLHYSTYKALCRRDGVYTSATAGFRDFNADLVEPITKRLATGWERTFQNRLPKAFELYTKASSKILHQFHEKVEERARLNGVGLANLARLKNQIYTYEQLFNDLYGVLITSMTELQREANRDFTPTIVAIMKTVYDQCTAERGPGSFMRMKSHMIGYVDQVRKTMFQQATNTVQAHLNQMCKNLQQTMENKADEIFVSMRHDYLQVLGGVNVDQKTAMTKEDRAMRAEIKPLLLTVDEKFKAVLEPPPELEVTVQEAEDMDVEANGEETDEMHIEANDVKVEEMGEANGEKAEEMDEASAVKPEKMDETNSVGAEEMEVEASPAHASGLDVIQHEAADVDRVDDNSVESSDGHETDGTQSPDETITMSNCGSEEF